MRFGLTIMLIDAAILGLVLLVLLLGAVAAIYSRLRRGKEMNALDGVMTGVLFGAAMVLNVVVVTICLGWCWLLGKEPAPALSQYMRR